MTVSEYVVERVTRLLQERRVVVWYDAGGDFHGLLSALSLPGLVCADAKRSVLEARRIADAAWRTLFDPGVGRAGFLLIYLPRAFVEAFTEQRVDVFEPFARAGARFGAVPGEQLGALARACLAGREHEVDRLFRSGRPGLARLDALAAGIRHPALREALGTEVVVEVAAQVIARARTVEEVAQAAPVLSELRRLLADALGFQVPDGTSPGTLVEAFARWVLLSEFAFDLPGHLPTQLVHQPRAAEAHRAKIYQLCDQLRRSTDHRDAYIEVAERLEGTLGLAHLGEQSTAFGDRDTFSFEDRAALRRAQELTLKGDVAAARRLFESRKTSIWRLDVQRDQRWRLLGRCLDLLEAGSEWTAPSGTASVAAQIRAACDDRTGLWQVDQAQRLVEQVAVHPGAREGLAETLEHTRLRYRTWIEKAQEAFLTAVTREGWPPEGVVRATSTWARKVAPSLAAGRKVAYFMVDALRYEMGRELAKRLEALGTVTIEPAAGVVPAETVFGMAALLPGAEAAWTCRMEGEELVPVVGGRVIPDVPARMETFRALAGSRFRDVRLGDLLSWSNKQLEVTMTPFDLVVVRSTEIDEFGERLDPLAARQLMTEVVGHLVAAVTRLVGVGFRAVVLAADHGYMLLPEILPGDRVPEPPGRWVLRKRRALIGEAFGRPDSVHILDAASLGLVGPVREVALPRGTKSFRGNSGYFHEGLSLQESVVPIIALEARAPTRGGSGSVEVELSFKSPHFTNRIFLVTAMARFGDLLTTEPMPIRIAVEQADSGAPAGGLGDLDERDDATGQVYLAPRQVVKLPIRVDDDFNGRAIVIRALHATLPGVEYGRLVLANRTLESP